MNFSILFTNIISLNHFIYAFSESLYVTRNIMVVHGHNPETGTFTQSENAEDDGHTPPADTVINNAGDVHIFVSVDGSTYKVVNNETWREFSAMDSDNVRED
jgi:hypothetical protein